LIKSHRAQCAVRRESLQLYLSGNIIWLGIKMQPVAGACFQNAPGIKNEGENAESGVAEKSKKKKKGKGKEMEKKFGF